MVDSPDIMSFCVSCGAQVTGKFCTTCGRPVDDAAGSVAGPAGPVPPAPPVPPAAPVTPAAPAGPAAPKKKGPLFYGLIGCGALLVLGLLAVVGAGLFVAHKAKQAGLDPELAQRNPALAAAKMMVAVNPELELVSSDDGRGTVTIREKKTGKTVTLDLDGIKKGRIAFEGDNGERVEIHGEGGGSAKLPAWVPAYPGATVQVGINAESGEGEGGTASLKIRDSVEKVAAFYEQGFKSAGLTVAREPSGGSVVITAQDDGRTAGAVVSTAGGETVVTLTFEKKQ